MNIKFTWQLKILNFKNLILNSHLVIANNYLLLLQGQGKLTLLQLKCFVPLQQQQQSKLHAYEKKGGKKHQLYYYHVDSVQPDRKIKRKATKKNS